MSFVLFMFILCAVGIAFDCLIQGNNDKEE